MRQGWRNIWERGKGQVRREKGHGAGSFVLGAIPKLSGSMGTVPALSRRKELSQNTGVVAGNMRVQEGKGKARGAWMQQ